jgi:hypothetical protein
VVSRRPVAEELHAKNSVGRRELVNKVELSRLPVHNYCGSRVFRGWFLFLGFGGPLVTCACAQPGGQGNGLSALVASGKVWTMTIYF